MRDVSPSPVQRFDDLLTEERQAIRIADFARLSELIARKEALLAALADLPAEQTARLRSRAEENQQLLQATLRGLRNARDRLQQIKTAAHGFTGYDNRGQPQSIRNDTGTVEKRA